MTDVQICNLALARLGDARITALTDATAQAQYCSLFYEQTLGELQSEFDWQFCRKLATATATTAPAFGYSSAYTLPTDFLRLLRVNGIDEDENFGKWEIVSGTLHTSLPAPIQIDYIARVTDTTKFPPVFIEIFSSKLATNLAMPLTGSKELFSQMAEVFSANIQRPAVKALILSESSPRPAATLTEDELCRQAILRVGTAEQFGPSSQAMLLAKSLYPQVRDALLLTGSWTWAMKSTTVIETLPRPEYKWAYRYAIPSDCLRVFRVNDYDATSESAWEVSGNFILTNADSGSPAWVAGRSYEVGNAVSNNGAVYRCVVAGSTKEPGVTTGWQSDWDVWLGSAITLEYVRKVTEVTLFDSLFIDLLTASLAAKLAIPLTGDAGKAGMLAKETEVLGKNPAMRRDSTERKPKIKPAWTSSKLVSSRSGGDGIESSKVNGGGPAGGISYPSLLVTVGSVTNLPSGSTPTVTNTGTNDTAVLNFGLPQGPAGTVNVGTTTTGAAGTNASVTATGTPENRVLNFTIPQGIQGIQGIQGPQGTTGATGPANTLSIGTVTAGPTAAASITGTAPNQTLNLTLQQSALLSSAKTTLTGNGTLKTFSVSGLKSSDPNHVIVSINGVVQEPTTDYTVSQGAGTITFTTAIPNGAKIVVVALGLYSPTTQRDPDNYIHAFALNTAGTFSYYGLLLNSDIPTTGSAAAVAKWIITRSALSSAGAVTATAQATNVAWNNRETATYA
jgi:hypothetical protein